MSVGLAISNIARWTSAMLILGEQQSDLEIQKFNLKPGDKKDQARFALVEKALQIIKAKFVQAKDDVEVWKDILKSWLALSKLFNELLRSQ